MKLDFEAFAMAQAIAPDDQDLQDALFFAASEERAALNDTEELEIEIEDDE